MRSTQAARMELGSTGLVKPQDDTVVPGVAVTGTVKLAADSLSLASAIIGQSASMVAQKDLVPTGNHSYRASLDARANTLTADTLLVSDLAHLEAKGDLAVKQLTAGRVELVGGGAHARYAECGGLAGRHGCSGLDGRTPVGWQVHPPASRRRPERQACRRAVLRGAGRQSRSSSIC